LAAYFASDVHLRLDRPDRNARFAHWVDQLSSDDSLVIVGDLCDFWMASRQRKLDPLACAGLAALAAFRARGGLLTLLAGNHDACMGPAYERVLGTGFVAEPLVKEFYGLRVHLAHGHKLGTRGWWKAGMESRLFLHAFANAPGVLARKLEALLDHRNEQTRAETDRRYLADYRRFADRLAGAADLVVLGHIHRPHDDRTRLPRLIVLGGWHAGSSYLRVCEHGAEFVVVPHGARTEDSRQEEHAEI
jgi:UDP-2,3-diacylglucosamine hydrolase